MSVHLTHAGIVSNRLNVRSRKQRRDSPGTLFRREQSLVGDRTFLLKFALKVTHPAFEHDFDRYPLIRPTAPTFGSQCSKFYPKPVHFRRSYSRTRERWRPFFRPIKYLQYSPSGEMYIWNMYPPLVNVRARSSLITESSQYCSDRRRKLWRRRTFTLELSVLAGSCSRPRPRPTCTC